MKIIYPNNSFIYQNKPRYNNSKQSESIVEKSTPCYEFGYNFYYQPNFTSASKITVDYVYNKSRNLLPDAVLRKIDEYSLNGQSLNIQLLDFHKAVYQKLFDASSLSEVKELYPEFAEVKDATVLSEVKSKAVDVIKAKSSLETFTLEYLKKLYTPVPLTKIVEEYGFSNTSLLNWLNVRLNIPKLKGNYLMLLKMNDSVENQKNAKLLKRVVFDNPEVEARRIAASVETHRTDAYRQKQREIIDGHRSHPEISKATTFVNYRMWASCPEVRAKMSEFASSKPEYAELLHKIEVGETLTPQDISALKILRKTFWNMNLEGRKQMGSMRTQAYSDYKKINGVDEKKC